MNKLRTLIKIIAERGIHFIYYILKSYFNPNVKNYILYSLGKKKTILGIFFVCSCILIFSFVFINYLIGIILLGVIGVIFMFTFFYEKPVSLSEMKKAVKVQLKGYQPNYENFISLKKYLGNDVTTLHHIESSGRVNDTNDLILASLDNDGRAICEFGELPNLIMINENDFNKRRRFTLDIVLKDGFVLIKKSYKGAIRNFYTECYNLLRIQNEISCPNIFYADTENLILYKALVKGSTIRNLLVEKGADILNVNTENENAIQVLSSEQRITTIWERGKKYMPAILSQKHFDDLFRDIRQLHKLGLTKLSLTFGNVILDDFSNKLILIDFEECKFFSNKETLFFFYKNVDRTKFNRIYGQNVLTREKVKQTVLEDSSNFPSFYAPIDFGNGFIIGAFWGYEAGIGRWNYFNKKYIPKWINGKRVLDLGVNNAYLSLLMLKEGNAKSVYAVELDSEFYERAKLVKNIFEWREDRDYELTIKNNNMLKFLDGEFGFEYDIITFFCSIYYLEEKEIEKIIEKASLHIPQIIIQANDGTREEAKKNKFYKSSTSYLERVLLENGYSDITKIMDKNLRRPLLYAKSLKLTNKNAKN